MLLAHMYYNKGGPTWSDSTGWLGSGEHCSTWYGVTCDPNLQAQTLNLIVSNALGDANCATLSGAGDVDACNWMENAANHHVTTTSETYDYLIVSLITTP